jgi:hypothetical protein
MVELHKTNDRCHCTNDIGMRGCTWIFGKTREFLSPDIPASKGHGFPEY